MDIAKRFHQNPLLKPSDLQPGIEGMEITCFLNPGVFRFDGKTWLLLRVAERPVQKQGVISFPVYNKEGKIEVLSFDENDPELDASDPRVIGYAGQNYLTTMSYLRLVSSEDGIHFKEEPDYPPIFGKGALEAHGMIFPPHNKDCALFEEKINGKYFALHRPSSPELGGNYIWLAESPDRLHWGNHRCVATTRPDSWDCARVGAGAAPIRTEEGWLEIYHGADYQNRYCLGALLLDLNDPSKVIARSKAPIMEPTAPYEQTGFFGNVVFTNGHLVEGDKVTVYYGASDEVICGAEFSIGEILRSLKS